MSSSPIDDLKPSENSYLLDSSALLAVILSEPGHERVIEELERGALMSAVNLAEVAARLSDFGLTPGEIVDSVNQLQVQSVGFEDAHAYGSGLLRAATKPFGLSLGDRACLATALILNMPVLTADRQWVQVDIGVTIELCR